MNKKNDSLTYSEAVNNIIEINEHIREFWSEAEGWAPIEAADLLSKSRLDWLTSLSYSLKKWNSESIQGGEEGDLILAWSNLGSLVEGTMKFFLSVYYMEYKKTPIFKYQNKVDPDGVMFNDLRLFFYNKIWSDNDREEKNEWLKEIQGNRNAIHAYKDRDIKNLYIFRQQVKNYLVFLLDLLERVPYPDDYSRPNLNL